MASTRIIFIILIIVISFSEIYGEKKDKEPKIKDKTIKKELNDEKKESIRETNEFKKEKVFYEKDLKIKIKIANNTAKLENFQTAANNLMSDIKRVNTAGDINYQGNSKILKNILNDINTEDEGFNSILEQDQKNLIKKQNDIIKSSISVLYILIDAFEKKQNENITKEDLFLKVKKIENEANKIYRQYRAIEWILFEQ